MRKNTYKVGLVLLVSLVLIVGAWLVRSTSTPSTPTAPPLPAVNNVDQAQTVSLVAFYPDRQDLYDVEVTGEATVEEVLRKVISEHGLNAEMTDYGESMGIFVESIGGLAGDTDQNLFWHLYVNGELSPVGASFAKVVPGDWVMWRYEEMQDIE